MLTFIDESGYPRPSDNNSFSVLLSVCIREDRMMTLTKKIYKLKKYIYKYKEISEIKSTNLINRKTIERSRTDNKSFAEKMIKIAANCDIKTFCIVMPRPQKEIVTPENILPKQYKLLIEKIEYYSEIHDSGKVIFVFDEINEKEDMKIANAFNHYLYTSKLGKQFKNILETPLFVSSKITPAIQIADIYAGVVRKYYECGLHINAPSNDFEIWLCKLFKIIYKTTEDFWQPNGKFFERGFQYVDNLNYIKKIKKD